MPINKVQYGGQTLIDLTSLTVTASKILKGYRGIDKAGNFIDGTAEQTGGGLPDGIEAIATGEYTLNKAVTGSSSFAINHNMGEVPDLFLFYAEGNIATRYSMIFVARSSEFTYNGTSNLNLMFYHGNTTTTLTGANVSTNYGVKTLNASQAVITSYSTSTSYGWRAGKYRWVAVKFT